MGTLTRRNVNGEATRSNSLWEQEANNYWQEMEPAKRYKKISGFVGIAILGLLAVGGVVWTARTTWSHVSLTDIASLKDRFFPMATVNSTIEADISPVSTPQEFAPPPVNPKTPASGSRVDPAAIDLLRARCRVRGVQTRWHEETCRKLCIRDPQNTACMNGCSYGSITVTKITCDHLDVGAISTAQQCPDGVNCLSACKAYENEAPVPATRMSCERACTNIVPSSCSRILQIYRDLYKGSLQ